MNSSRCIKLFFMLLFYGGVHVDGTVVYIFSCQFNGTPNASECKNSSNTISDPWLCTHAIEKLPPYPDESETPAPAPDNLSVSWFVKETVLGLNLTWIQRGDRIHDMVKGYYVFISAPFTNSYYAQVFHFKEMDKFDGDKVLINYPCFGLTGKKVDPGQRFLISLKPLPIYTRKSQVQEIIKRIDVPGCSNKAVSQVQYCKDKRKQERKLRRRKKKKKANRQPKKSGKVHARLNGVSLASKPKHTWNEEKPGSTQVVDASSTRNPTERFTSEVQSTLSLLPLIIAVVVLLGSVLFVTVWKCRQWKRYKKSRLLQDNAKLLILINTTGEDELYKQTANVLTSMLGDKHIFNLWEFSTIEQPETWTWNQLSDCRHVLFICTPNGKRRYDEFLRKQDGFVDTYIAGIHQCTKENVKKAKATAIYFDKNPSCCVPNELSLGIKRFKIPESFKKFLKHIRRDVVLPQSTIKTDELHRLVFDLRKKPVRKPFIHRCIFL